MTNPHEGAAILGSWRHEFVPGESALPALVMLHGTGGSEREMVALGRSLAPGAALFAPGGRVNEGETARYYARSPDDPFDVPDLPERIDELASVVRAALLEYELGRRRVYAVGYSTGANAATALMIRHPGLLDGAVLLRGLLPCAIPVGLHLGGVRLLIAAGSTDAVVPPNRVRGLIAAMGDRGAEITEHWSARGHGLGQDDLDAASAWLASPIGT